MFFIKEINIKQAKICHELDSQGLKIWSKKQWENELKNKGVKVYALYFKNNIAGVCSIQLVLNEAQLNYFLIKKKYRRKGFGKKLMNFILSKCEALKIEKLLLEVSESNISAKNFYGFFEFETVGVRENYYKDGSNALIKRKKIVKK